MSVGKVCRERLGEAKTPNVGTPVMFAARCYASEAYAVMRCRSVCHVVHFVKTNRHIFKIFFTVGLPHHSSFSIINIVVIFQWRPPNGGIECRWGRQKS